MSAFDDITKKATEFLKSDQATEALNSQQAEDISDKLLDGVAAAVDNATGGAHSDKIADAKDAVDKKFGND